MRAIGYKTSQPITAADALIDIDLAQPEAKGHDILVEVKAVSVNPVDTKVRRNQSPENGATRVLGFDASGVVKAVGDRVSLFAGRRGVLRRRHQPSGLQQRIPSGR